MPVNVLCKIDKHLVTLHNVIFSNITGILSHMSYIFYQHNRVAMCHLNGIYWETYLTGIGNFYETGEILLTL